MTESEIESKSEAYKSGFTSGKAGLAETDNPYELITQESEDWKQGRWDAAHTDAYKEGYYAGVRSEPQSNNPYPPGSYEAEEWEAGRWKAGVSKDD